MCLKLPLNITLWPGSVWYTTNGFIWGCGIALLIWGYCSFICSLFIYVKTKMCMNCCTSHLAVLSEMIYIYMICNMNIQYVPHNYESWATEIVVTSKSVVSGVLPFSILFIQTTCQDSRIDFQRPEKAIQSAFGQWHYLFNSSTSNWKVSK